MENIRNFELERILNANYEVTGFYGYTSYIQYSIIPFEQAEFFEEKLEKFFEKYMKQAERLGCAKDNKIVIRLSMIKEKRAKNDYQEISNIYVGFYDNHIALGLGVFVEEGYTNYIKTKKIFDKNLKKWQLIHE